MMFLQAAIVAILMCVPFVSLADELAVGTRLSLKEDYNIIRTNRSDYIILNDVEVFLAPCKVYFFREPSQSFTTRLQIVYIPEYDVKSLNSYKNAGWHLERIINATTAYSYMPKFYSKKVFVVEAISKTNKSYVRVVDRSGVKYVFLLSKNVENTFTILD